MFYMRCKGLIVNDFLQIIVLKDIFESIAEASGTDIKVKC